MIKDLDTKSRIIDILSLSKSVPVVQRCLCTTFTRNKVETFRVLALRAPIGAEPERWQVVALAKYFRSVIAFISS